MRIHANGHRVELFDPIPIVDGFEPTGVNHCRGCAIGRWTFLRTQPRTQFDIQISVDFPAKPTLKRTDAGKFTVDNAELIQANNYMGEACFSVPGDQMAQMANRADLAVELMRMQLVARGVTISSERSLDTANGHLFEGQVNMPELGNQTSHIVVKMFMAQRLKRICQATVATVGNVLSPAALTFILRKAVDPAKKA